MKFYIISDGYIVAFGENNSPKPDMPRYEEVKQAMLNPPAEVPNKTWKLKSDITWELVPEYNQNGSAKNYIDELAELGVRTE